MSSVLLHTGDFAKWERVCDDTDFMRLPTGGGGCLFRVRGFGLAWVPDLGDAPAYKRPRRMGFDTVKQGEKVL